MVHRVLHLVHSNQRRGAEVFAAQLASSLESRGVFKNCLATLYQGAKESFPSGDLPVFKLEGTSGLLSAAVNPPLLFRLYGVLRKFRPDIIVAHGGDTLKYSASVSFMYRNAPVVYRNIGIASDWANTSLKVNINRMLLGKVDTVVSVSDYTRDDFISVYGLPEAQVKVIPNGVDCSSFMVVDQSEAKVRTRQQLGLPQDGLVLISVGNLSEEKGHQGLLPMMGDLELEGQELHLLLVGEGPLRHELEEQSRQMGISNRVHFLGRRDDVPEIMAGADIFVLSSRTEGMPAVLIEAGLAGLPTVAFSVGGVAEVVEHEESGILVDPGDFQQLRQAVLDLSQDEDRRLSLGKAAAIRCRNLFSMDRVADDYQELLLSLVQPQVGEQISAA